MQRKKTNASQYQQNKYVYNYLCICISVCVCVCENQLDPNTPSSLHCYGCCCGEKSAHNDNKTAKKSEATKATRRQLR